MFKNIKSSLVLLVFALSFSAQVGYAQNTQHQQNSAGRQHVVASDAQPQSIEAAFELLAAAEVKARQVHDIDPDDLARLYDYIWTVVANQYPDVSKLTDWAGWRHRYDDQLFTVEDLDHAISTMVASLHDLWLSYTSPDEVAAWDPSTVSLGIRLQPADNGMYSVNYVAGFSPAYPFFRKGDLIESVNNKPLQGMSLAQAEGSLEGKVGTELELVFAHDGKSDHAKITLLKTQKPESEARVLPGDILYLRLSEFQPGAVNKLESEATDAIANYQGTITGIIFDLRGNPGGLVSEGEKVSSMFIGGGGIVLRMQERWARLITEKTDRALSYQPFQLLDASPAMLKRIDVLQHAPMIVMIDGTSASCSEIVTAALEDNHRALVLGETSWGKGVAWKEQELVNGGSLRCTSGIITSPNGRSWAGIGLRPDVALVEPRHSSVDIQLAGAVKELLGATTRSAVPSAKPPVKH